MPPSGDLASNPGMWPDWELNQWPFSLQANTQSTEPYKSVLEILNITLLLHRFESLYNKNIFSSDQCGLVGWASSHKAKGCWFDFPSGYVQVVGLVPGWGMYEKQLIDVFLTLMFPSLSFSLPSPSLKIN